MGSDSLWLAEVMPFVCAGAPSPTWCCASGRQGREHPAGPPAGFILLKLLLGWIFRL